MFKLPRFLQRGAHIRVVATAGRVDAVRLAEGIRTIRARGFHVTVGEHVMDQWGYLAGRDEDRARDFIEALCDERVDAVFLARGGWGSSRLLPHLDRVDFSHQVPKILMGYSDITALHLYFQRFYHWVTFHGPVVEMDWSRENGDNAFKMLAGEKGMLGDGPLEPLTQETPDSLEAIPWTGGNLSLVVESLGTPYAVDARDKILYLEEVSEPIYRIDRMMTHLWLSGELLEARGVVFGEATRCEAPLNVPDYTALHVVTDICQRAGVALWWGLPAGHGPRKVTLPLGIPLAMRDHRVVMVEPAVTVDA